MTQQLAIEVKDLEKRFGTKAAVEKISFNTRRGEVFGFLGPNGAGKTTTIKMLTTLLPPTAGQAVVLGHDVRTQGSKIRQRIGVVQQQESFDQGLRTEASMDIYGLLWDVPREERRRRIDELISRFDMQEFRRTPTIDLSSCHIMILQVARDIVLDM